MKDTQGDWVSRRVQKLIKTLKLTKVEKEVQEQVQVLQAIKNGVQNTNFEKAKYAFIDDLNAFLGQSMTTVYVHTDLKKQQIQLIEIPHNQIDTFFKWNDFKNKFTVAGIGTIRKMEGKRVENLSFTNSPLEEAYYHSLQRFRKTKKYIYWNIKNGSGAIEPTSEGPINEAYAAYVLQQKTVKHSGLEYNVRDFSLNGVLKVDNISGILRGDVDLKKVQVSIKSKNASDMGVSQLLAIALVITKTQGTITKKMVEIIQQDLEKNKSIIGGKVSSLTQEQVEQMSKEIVYQGLKLKT